MNKLSRLVAVATVASVLGVTAVISVTPASACPGVIATVLNNCALDDAHKALGSPLNNWPNVLGLPQNGSGGVLPNNMPLPPIVNNPMGQPPTFQPPVRMGNMCVTQAGAYPGPFNPVGISCMAATPWGPMPGQVM
jgi:hypothetical protein